MLLLLFWFRISATKLQFSVNNSLDPKIVNDSLDPEFRFGLLIGTNVMIYYGMLRGINMN